MEARSVFAAVAVVVAGVAHGLLGLFIFASGIVVHPTIVTAGLVAWVVAIYLLSRWRRHPGRVLLVPVVLAGAFLVAVFIGERFGLVGA